MFRRNFAHTHRIGHSTSLRLLILWDLNHLAEGEVTTAWAVAHRIDALGSSVSSKMFKMRNAGVIEEAGGGTKQHGRYYRAVNLEAYQ